MDTFNYVNINNPRSRTNFIETMHIFDLLDTFRYFHPSIRRYTWRKKHPIKQARLDYFIISKTFSDLITSCQIRPGYRTDHSMVEIQILINKFSTGKGMWKFNNSLLKHLDFLDTINKSIDDKRLNYALPIYNLDNIHNIRDTDIQLQIEDDIFLEMLFLRLRGESIKFSSNFKKKEHAREKQLIKDIEYLENINDLGISHILKDKKN